MVIMLSILPLVYDVFDAVKSSLTDADKVPLNSPYTPVEVKTALDTMYLDKRPEPDGMTTVFYKKHCCLIGDNVMTAVLHVLNHGSSIREVNEMFITLVPKIKNGQFVKDFRSISLCNVIYNLVAKVLAMRLCLVLDSVIGDHQGTFLKGQLIYDNIVVAHEILHTLRKKRTGKIGVWCLSWI